jgi:hypothetical protein
LAKKERKDLTALATKKKRRTSAKISKQEIEQAIKASGGIISAAAVILSKAKSEALGKPFSISRQAISDRVKKDPELAELLDHCNESNLDLAELELIRQIREGNLTAIIFYLKCKGKNRGYIEKSRTELTGGDGGPVALEPPKVNLGALTDEELETYAALSAKARDNPSA